MTPMTRTTPPAAPAGHYRADFERLVAQAEGANLRRLRQAAWARFEHLGFPTPRNEDWKFTSVAPLLQVPFRAADETGREAGGGRGADRLPLPEGLADGPRVVLVDGRFVPELSAVPAAAGGVVIADLATALREHAALVEPHLARHARFEEHAFAALNTALFTGGAFVSLAKGQVVEQPIQVVHLATAGGGPTLNSPRVLVITGANSQAALIESYAGPDDAVYFTNAVTEIVLGENAVVDHYKLQEEGRQAFHVADTQVHQERSSTFTTHYFGFGGGLVRNEVRVLLNAAGCESTVNGLYLAAGTQHLDNHTVIDHAMPHCASHELYKGILDGRAHGVFNGKIFVRQDAQKTDAKQTNQTLLLSDDAVINTKPQLEIYADDVKCTHGATVGQLDAEAVFYLRSRGIGLEEARSLLTFAFANDVIGRVRLPALRDRLGQAVLRSQHLTRVPGGLSS
jgi:Fe-S cluster assembly protein SufD